VVRKKSSRWSKNLLGQAGLVSIAAVLALLLLCYFLLSGANKSRAYEASELLIEQVGSIIDNNEELTKTLVGSLKEDYITRAKSIAYLLECEPEITDDRDELSHISKLISVDEINIFDTTGTIVSGTVPKYYGYSFDSGEQIAYFAPMLKDKELSMCQDVTPNTAEGKAMMYAICWNESGTAMVQVGIEPLRLINELNEVSIPEVLNNITPYKGAEILVADAKTGSVVGCTNPNHVDKNLDTVGLDLEGQDIEEFHHFSATIEGKRLYCTAQRHNQYIILVMQDVGVVNANMGSTLTIAFSYLALTAVVIALIVHRMTSTILEEQRNANVDQLSDLLNRRAYESALQEFDEGPLPQNLVYVSMDLNGLKDANDSLGHEAGDKLIQGASRCMGEKLGSHGRVFRVGGDEFVALIEAADDAELQLILREFRIKMEDVSREENIELSVSYGTAMASEFPDATIAELAKIADKRMYESKRRYYEMAGHDRRASRR